jgi:hypothetical protein
MERILVLFRKRKEQHEEKPLPSKRKRLSEIATRQDFTDDSAKSRSGISRLPNGTIRVFDFNTLAAVLSRQDVIFALKSIESTLQEPRVQDLYDQATEEFVRGLLRFRDASASIQELNRTMLTPSNIGFDERSFDAFDYDEGNFNALSEWILSVWRARAVRNVAEAAA